MKGKMGGFGGFSLVHSPFPSLGKEKKEEKDFGHFPSHGPEKIMPTEYQIIPQRFPSKQTYIR